VVDAVKANRFYIFTNREFLEEVKARHREIEEAFPDQDPPADRIRFETMRSEMVRNLMATGDRPVGSIEAGSFGIGFNSSMAD
jgi:hypothetical protein